ncbi:heparan-alpha-glucosaminide N-acetyltransferase [Dendrosporobacter sp. 1207_IL3150]|uniref:heparan-alpha-glucosaminide N-acetyltransferase n=1 Tax=Dendrosporobacter sp. 1207_IL3150 TaxID=3084054 RepID=UPI002FD8D6FF
MKEYKRIWEIDFFRGLAIILMILFHLVFDFKEFLNVNLNYSSGIWFYTGKSAAVLFIFICGLSGSLTNKHVRNGVNVLIWGLALSVLTYFYNPILYIRFGILHLLGVSLITYPFVRPLSISLLFILGIAAIIAGFITTKLGTTNDWLLTIGLTSPSFASLDYYPLLPWYGVFLFGVAAGKYFYYEKTSIMPVFIDIPLINYLGRHSLLIYLIHQPILLSLIFAYKKLIDLP